MAIILLVLLAFSLPSQAAIKDMTFGNVVVSEITSIYDADTFRVNVASWPDIVGKRMSVRVLGIDAPEIRGKCKAEKTKARAAKRFTVNALRSAKKIELRNIKRGKYFRLLADVFVDGKRLADLLVKAGHARLYGGGTRGGWCG